MHPSNFCFHVSIFFQVWNLIVKKKLMIFWFITFGPVGTSPSDDNFVTVQILTVRDKNSVWKIQIFKKKSLVKWKAISNSNCFFNEFQNFFIKNISFTSVCFPYLMFLYAFEHGDYTLRHDTKFDLCLRWFFRFMKIDWIWKWVSWNILFRTFHPIFKS